MTIQTQSNKSIVLGNGSQTQFAFGFTGVAAAYIEVIYTDASGNETVLVAGNGATQYQITLNAAVEGALWGEGGTVTYNPSGTPIPSGSSLTIFRTLPLTQAISLQNQISLATLGNGAETGLDTGTMQLQQVFEQIARAFTAPISDPSPPLPVPTVAQRANMGAVFDGAGNLTAGALPSSGVISAAMQPVVDAATLALGRAAFGLGTMATEGIGAGLQDDGAGNARVYFPVSQVASNQNIVAADHLNAFLTTGPITLTYPRANTLFNGFGHWIYNNSVGAITLAIDSHDTFQGYTSGQAINIPPNASAFISTDAATSGNWLVEWGLATAAPVSGGDFVGLTIQNNAVTPNTQIDIAASEITIPNILSGAFKVRNAAITINCATTGLNGMDTGSPPTSGWLFLYAISNGSTSGAIASLSSSSPTMPAGFTYRKRIGAMRTDSSAHLFRTRQVGRDASYTVTAASNTTALPIIANGIETAWTAFQVAGLSVPTTAAKIKVAMFAQLTANSAAAVAVAPNNAYSTTLEVATNPCVVGGDANVTTKSIVSMLCELVLESVSIYVGTQNSPSTSTWSAYGWTDNL